MAGRWDWIDRELKSLSEQGIVRRRRRVIWAGNGECEIDGRRLQNFAGNDYLDLYDARVIAAARGISMLSGGEK
jgi:7-keto-8-aminopelargonate synthetase-like enzyme